MIFRETPLGGSYVVELDPILDDRGHFARTFAVDEFERQGLNAAVVQCNLSYNLHRGTLRGMHYQSEPHGECKLVRCARGAIYDVLVDLRPASSTYCCWFGIELTPDNGRLIYAPVGVAHGLLTLTDETEVLYQMSAPYVPDAARGVRWDDPAFAIDWPAEVRVISERDRTFPDFTR